MALFATLEVVTDLIHVLNAFVFFVDSASPTETLSNISNPVNVIKTINYCMQTLIGDSMLVCGGEIASIVLS